MPLPILASLLIPVIKDVAVNVITSKKKKSTTQEIDHTAVADEIATAVAKRMSEDPAVVNETNSEPLIQSRVVNGTVFGIVMSAGVVYLGIKNHQYDERFFMELAVLAGTGYAFLGRVGNWSSPMWSRVAKLFKRN